MKTTKNQSMMAYVVLEDATGSIEMLAFSNTLNQYGNYLQENQVIVVQGQAVRARREGAAAHVECGAAACQF